MLTAEPSYFNFLMQNRGLRRTPVPFAQAAGVLPELARSIRFRSAVRFAPTGCNLKSGRVLRAGAALERARGD
jgi:hypothetical protein